jgi:YgiT-type zinc finger domain-containing protein
MTLEPPLIPVPCPRCEQPMRPGVVKTAIWQGERLFVVEDVPAQVCDACVEQFYDDLVIDTLRTITENAFTSETPDREVVVPIFSLKARLPERRVLDEPLQTY